MHRRRQVIRAGVTVGLVGIAGCGGDDTANTTTDSDSADDEPTPEQTPTEAETTTTADQPTEQQGRAIGSVAGRYTQYQATAAHDGHVPEASIPGSVSEQWTYPASTGDDQSVAGPLLVDGTLYALVAAGGANLVSLDAATGTVNYEASVQGVLGTPAYAEGTIYNAGQRLEALSADDGSQQWQRFNPYGFVSLTVTDGSIYASDSRNITALSTADGSEQWSTEPTQGDFTSTQPPAVEGEMLYTGAAAATAIDVADGTVAWETTLDAPVTTGPTVGDGQVFVGTDEGTAYGLAADTGAETLSVDTGSSFFGLDTDFAYADGTLVVPADESVLAYDVANGSQLWEAPVDFASGPVIAGDTVLGLGGGGVTAISLADGTVEWQRGELTTVIGSPTVVGGGSGVFAPLGGVIRAFG